MCVDCLRVICFSISPYLDISTNDCSLFHLCYSPDDETRMLRFFPSCLVPFPAFRHGDADPDASAYYDNFVISVEYFKSSSCLVRDAIATKRNIDEFQHPLTNSTRECTSSEMLGFSKLVCVDGELKTFYYEASDTRCMSSPKAVIDSPSCMMDSVDLYHKLSCKDPPPEKVSVVAPPPPLDRDSSDDDNMAYFHVMTYYDDDDDTGSCSMLESEQYYSAYPGEGERA